jgi:regulator of sigma E protease
VIADSPAQQAGLIAGDRIVVADGVMIDDWHAWVEYVRQRPGIRIQIDVERKSRQISLELTPALASVRGEEVGRIGAYVRLPEENQHDTMRVVVKYGVAEAVPAALAKTFEMTQLTLRALWKMVIGQASVENLSGPVSIAKFAGQTATIGMAAFFGFLAIVSISLGILNLLPIPVLDGGHLLYYLIELVRGSPLSDAAQMAGQRLGIILLLALMSFAIYNDLVRIIE